MNHEAFGVCCMNSRRKLYLVTLVTALRVPLVFTFFAGAIFHAHRPFPWLFALAFGMLVASAVTDLIDGYLARRFGVETRLGSHADPLVDKMFYLISLPLLVYVATKHGHVRHGTFLLVLTVLFLARDQWVTFLRSIGSMFGAPGGAHWLGKVRTCVNFILICAVYYFEESPWPLINAPLLYSFEIAALGLNLFSLYTYTHRYWPYLRRSAALAPPPFDGPGGHRSSSAETSGDGHALQGRRSHHEP